MEKSFKLLVGKPEGKKRPLGSSRRRWEDNIKIGHKGVYWIHLA
jgi:hypothetical protein